MLKAPQPQASSEAEAAISSFFMQRRALEQLRDALALIPLQQQTAYREALARCPSIVETESNSMQFLLFDDFNAWNAAERLVNYWQLRKEVFGERAFLPIFDLSGNGALTPEDLKLILSGSFLLTAEDTVVVDRSLEPENVQFSVETQIRRTFFFLQHLARHRCNAIPGQGYKFVVRYKGFKSMDQRVASKSAELCKNAFPIRIQAVHLVFAVDFQLGILRNVVGFLCKLWGMSSNYLFLHHCETPGQALAKLIPHGVLPFALPLSLGGTYNPEVEFVQFLTQLGFSMTSPIRGGHFSGKESFLPWRCDASSQHASSTNSSDHPLVRNASAEVTASNLKCLNEAIDLLPESDKAAYMLATRQVPDLVEEESPPLVFLEFADFDTWAAAFRLCNYWRHRLQVFDDRAFLPMTLEGAMGADGKKALEVGMHYLLREDKSGRTVWCAESLLKMDADPEMDFKMRAKMYFYIASIILKNPNSRRDGVLGIPLISRIEIPIIDSRWIANLTRCGKMFKESFPIRSAGTHVVFKPTGGILSTVFLSVFLRLYTSLYGEPQNIHVCANAEAEERMYKKFEEIGIAKEGLPKQIGGQDGPSEFLSRQRMEESRSASPSTFEVSEAAVKDMRTAISLILNENKVAYLEALTKAPELAEQESLWESFLRFTNGDATKAGIKFVKYWEVRQELFGDRAFLPLTQTFEGALERKDVGVLQTGYFMQLPCVESGESVLYCDGTKLQKSSSSLSRARCKFYMLSIMAENATSQTRGFDLLYFLSDPSFDRVFKDHFFERLLPVMPVRVNHVHLLGLDLSPTNGSNLDNSIGFKLNETRSIFHFPRTAGSSVMETHVGTSREDLCKGLLQHGFTKQGLPKALFGDLGYDDFVKWQELRVRYEWGLFTNSRELELSSRYLIPRNKLIVHEQNSEKVERKRRMTIILSRRKRERERMSLEGMQEEAMEQRERHRKLRRLNETLQELIEKANEIVKIAFCNGSALVADRSGTLQTFSPKPDEAIAREKNRL